jgi:dihydroorotate dehydrogenase electron transfer subunit
MSDDQIHPQQQRQVTATILQNRKIARETFLLSIDTPTIANAIAPGQFLMLRPLDSYDPLLGRPFALWDVLRNNLGTPVAVEVVYQVLGRGTALLSERKVGEKVCVWGPLGHSFGPPPISSGPAVFVAGGIGHTPFLSLAQWWQGRLDYGGAPAWPGTPQMDFRLYHGVRTADLFSGLDLFERAGVVTHTATDDGSLGYHGFVTGLLERDLDLGLRPAKVIGCGPPAMLKALSKLVEMHGLDCDFSLENHMACGFGACFSCVAPIRQSDGSIDLKRVCVEGPIFPASSVVF